jgi:hypothetical protein
MAELKQPVLIGDNVAARAEWLGKFLSDYYNVTAQSADTFDKICQLARESNVSVIFLADTLPYSFDNRDAEPVANFNQLRGINRRVRLVRVVTDDSYSEISGVRDLCYIRLPSFPPTPDQHDLIINSLNPLSGIMPLATSTIEKIALLVKWRGQSRTLREQIRSLSYDQELKHGQRQLYHIIRSCIDCRSVERIKVESLTPGKSGALVFHLSVLSKSDGAEKRGKDNRTKEYVLKLSETKDIWKLQSEVSGYLQASTSEVYSKYKTHLPALRIPYLSKASTENEPAPEEFKYIVGSSLSWDAIYYDFLGGSLGECMSLETALISAPEKLREKMRGKVHTSFSLSDEPSALKDFRINFLKSLLATMSEIWYLNQPCVDRKLRRLWKRENAPDRQYLPLPPYQLTARTKRWVQEFLDSGEAEMGSRLGRLPGARFDSGSNEREREKPRGTERQNARRPLARTRRP